MYVVLERERERGNERERGVKILFDKNRNKKKIVRLLNILILVSIFGLTLHTFRTFRIEIG
jgi:hypothetical protein